MVVYYTPRFAREYRKLTENLRKVAKEKEKVFRKNPFTPSLKTHKLHGPLGGVWAFSVDQKNRIVFEFSPKGDVYFIAIGGHDDVY